MIFLMNAHARFLNTGQEKGQCSGGFNTRRLSGWRVTPRILVAVGVITIVLGIGGYYWAASGLLTGKRAAGFGDPFPAASGEHLTIAQTAALELLEGGQPHKPLRTSQSVYDPKAQAAARLVGQLQTGNDTEAAEAIRGLADLGGERNIEKLADVMNDIGWSDAVRTEAALGVLKAGNETDALTAIRGLAAIGGDANTDRLAGMVHDASLAQDRRLAAALGLGIIGTAQAGDELIAAFGEFSDPEIHAQLLDTLGYFPFPQIEEMWTEYLGASDTPAPLRTAAVEALANSSPEAAPFLLNTARSDLDPDVREAAAWALSAHAPNGDLGPGLADLASNEPEADVRRRLYEALPAQAENPAASLQNLIQSETDTAARVAGFNALGDAVRRNPSASIAGWFDTTVVPELTQIALSPETLNIRMRAVFALRRAGTPAALTALGQISHTETPPIAQAALNGLPTTIPTP